MKYRQVHMRQIASVRCIHQTNGGAAEVEIREKYYSGLQINSPPNTFYVPANISICLFSQKKHIYMPVHFTTGFTSISRFLSISPLLQRFLGLGVLSC
jgi:hypothetical protein